MTTFTEKGKTYMKMMPYVCQKTGLVIKPYTIIDVKRDYSVEGKALRAAARALEKV